MAQTTTNLGLTKPDYSETADIAVINSNFQTLDDVIGAWDTSSAGMNGTIKDIVSSNVSRIGSLESSVTRRLSMNNALSDNSLCGLNGNNESLFFDFYVGSNKYTFQARFYEKQLRISKNDEVLKIWS